MMVDVGAYRAALEALPIGDAAITEVFDPNFGPDQHVAMIRVSAAEQDPEPDPHGDDEHRQPQVQRERRRPGVVAAPCEGHHACDSDDAHQQ